MSLEQLRDLYRHYLFEDFLPFMGKYVIDHQYGGFMCNTDRDGTNLTGDKDAWYEGRGIWVYSFLYNNFRRNEKHLEIARKSLQFWISAADRKVTFKPHATRVENYHHPRHLMPSLLTIERMIRRGGTAPAPSPEPT